MRVKRVPVAYVPYAVFPVKSERATGMLIPAFSLTDTDGFTLKNFFYWAPRDNFDVTIYEGGGRFIHAPSSGKQVSRASLDNPFWQRRLLGAKTFL